MVYLNRKWILGGIGLVVLVVGLAIFGDDHSECREVPRTSGMQICGDNITQQDVKEAQESCRSGFTVCEYNWTREERQEVELDILQTLDNVGQPVDEHEMARMTDYDAGTINEFYDEMEKEQLIFCQSSWLVDQECSITEKGKSSLAGIIDKEGENDK